MPRAQRQACGQRRLQFGNAIPGAGTDEEDLLERRHFVAAAGQIEQPLLHADINLVEHQQFLL